jgi:hypothetical protein
MKYARRQFEFDLRRFDDAPKPPDTGGGKPPETPAPAPTPAPADPNAIAAQARADYLKGLGFGSEAELKAALEAAKKPAKEPTDEDVKKRLEALEKDNEILRGENRRSTISGAVAKVVESLKVELHSPTDFAEAVLRYVELDGDGGVIVKDETGQKRYNAQGKPLTVAELAEEVLKQKPYIVKKDVKSGPGAPPGGGTHGSGTEEEEIASLEKKPVKTFEEAQRIMNHYMPEKKKS